MQKITKEHICNIKKSILKHTPRIFGLGSWYTTNAIHTCRVAKDHTKHLKKLKFTYLSHSIVESVLAIFDKE
jgi:hypothetical protein